jgi:pseudouridylate synthase
MSQYLRIRPDVAAALVDGRPVVALESTIIAHGMPYPDNVETALQLEADVAAEGALAATIAICDGAVRIGLTPEEIERIGAPDADVVKVSRRDMAFVIQSGGLGATTVAATMIAAHMAGIAVFATGGIGGVHRGASETFDISADLEELSTTPVTVVCAGAKSILDIGLTLEYLETRGVPVIGYGTSTFPAFYTRDSGHLVEQRLDTPEAIAEVMSVRARLGLTGGIVVANPIAETEAMDPVAVDLAIDQAIAEADAAGITGKETTPFLLSRITELTGSESLTANIALVRGNVRLAARIAGAYSHIG